MRKLLPFPEWPQADQDAWIQATRAPGILDDGGKGSHWSDGSKKSIRFGYARWLGYCAVLAPGFLALDPQERVTPDTIAAYIDHLKGSITPAGLFNYIKHLYDALRVIAPKTNWAWLRELHLRLEKLVVPRNKHPRIVDIYVLVDLGCYLMERSEGSADDPNVTKIQRAILYRDGLMITLLALRPVRRRNLTGIRIGKNLITEATGYRLYFAEHETKNHAVIEHPLPDWITPSIERYLTYYRPMFPNTSGHNGLWASCKGGALCSDAIYDRVAIHTKEALGHSVNLHLFRDCFATTIASDDPENVQIAADMLGHSSLAITERYYIQKNTSQACTSYQNTIADLHRKLQQAKDGKGSRHEC
ncbi:MAG: tyrosine-type recombinase/integrase [Alphaproteobacteria bacterium]|jgi:integrase/recombinase XerD|nr:tyrosine-type recombinase/integrase [Alphaproteobacteria bacterium]MBT4082551.1 tyrosine-type recombinase/integrase [Alphaproteobacteria bacterium]MBT5563010.1 tyrosine-type recombinase/integrase [Rhodospirillaceae bacterium]MBT7745381.1 tyrosine-type recombinase/integrase [Alphaproteobacteria bacterium]